MDVVGNLDVRRGLLSAVCCALLGHFALRAPSPSRHVWWVDFGVIEWGVVCAAATATVGGGG